LSFEKQKMQKLTKVMTKTKYLFQSLSYLFIIDFF